MSPTRHARARVLLSMAVAVALGACGDRDSARETSLERLRDEVRALTDSAAARSRADGWTVAVDGDSALIAVGIRTAALEEILSAAASRYLDDVRLHLDLDVVVSAGDEVRVRAGPVNAFAGRWELAVTVRRVDAVLSAESIDLVPADSNRIDLTVAVHIGAATGTALIDFRWDAAPLARVVCGDFRINESFTAFAHPRTDVMHGYIDVVEEEGRLLARPVLRDRIFVSPRPTEESWERLREILREQNRIFNCGLALSPERMETMLRDLLTRGFRFDLPSSVLRPIPLPGSVLNEVEVAGRRVAITVIPDAPRLIDERLWLRARVRPTALDDEVIRIAQ
jgi:hypothetical protein